MSASTEEPSYSLREVAERLGVSKRTLQRRIRDGAFPGRYLTPGRHGMETRITHAELEQALRDQDPKSRKKSGKKRTRRQPTVDKEQKAIAVTGDTDTRQAVALAIKDVLSAALAEHRAELTQIVQEGERRRDSELSAIRQGIDGLRASMAELADTVDTASISQEPTAGATDRAIARAMTDLDALTSLLES